MEPFHETKPNPEQMPPEFLGKELPRLTSFLMGKFVEINQTGYLCGVNP